MLCLAAASLALLSAPYDCRAQEAAELDDEVRPAPPSIGADVPLAYFGPAPSIVDKRLVGPVQLLNAGVIDEENGTIQLPLYTGYYKSGECLAYMTKVPSSCRTKPSRQLHHDAFWFARGEPTEHVVPYNVCNVILLLLALNRIACAWACRVVWWRSCSGMFTRTLLFVISTAMRCRKLYEVLRFSIMRRAFKVEPIDCG